MTIKLLDGHCNGPESMARHPGKNYVWCVCKIMCGVYALLCGVYAVLCGVYAVL